LGGLLLYCLLINITKENVAVTRVSGTFCLEKHKIPYRLQLQHTPGVKTVGDFGKAALTHTLSDLLIFRICFQKQVNAAASEGVS